MSLFDKFRDSRTLPSIELAAKKLDASARTTGLNNSSFPGMDQEQLEEITYLAYMTRVAIVMHWLRLIIRDPSYKDRAKKIHGEFERLTFSELPASARASLVAYIQRLIPLTLQLRSFLEDKTLSKNEIVQGMLKWPREWLSTLYEDETRLKRLSLIYGMDLIKYINESTAHLGKEVETCMWGGTVQ